jgi:acetylornithine deacetylase/succinyl-diaminopimelate desuccinylase-like protein
LERIWALPTFEIHGTSGGFTGKGAKTVIPSEAKAKVSLRLVPNQTVRQVQRLLRKAVKDAAPSYADIEIDFVHGADPAEVDTSAPVFEVLSRAFEEIEGRAPVPIRAGGSIPIISELGNGGAAVVLTGIGLPDDGLHAPNEKIGLDQFYKGMELFKRFFELLGEGGASPLVANPSPAG